MPLNRRTATVSINCFIDRARRSSFHTISVSPLRANSSTSGGDRPSFRFAGRNAQAGHDQFALLGISKISEIFDDERRDRAEPLD
jgi:hypothetical protein